MPDTYDFTIDDSAMDKVTRAAYFRLRRVAILAGDASLLPDGRKMTSAEVAAALGETQTVALETETTEVKPCC